MDGLSRLPDTIRDVLRHVLGGRGPITNRHEAEQALLQQSQHNSSASSNGLKWRRLRSPAGQRLILIFAAIVATITYLSMRTRSSSHPALWSASATAHQDPPRNAQYLHIDIPNRRPNTDICKTLASVAILNYPTPNLIAWNATINEQDKDLSPAVVRLSETLRHLDSLGGNSAKGTVMVLNEPGNWFQLRTEVLLKRYYAITKRAEERLQAEVGEAIKDAYNLNQTVLFAAQNDCSPHQVNQSACYAAAQSAGSARFLNADALIGPVIAVRTLLKEALKRARKDSSPDLQILFGEMYGEQELHREVLRRRQWSGLQRTWNNLGLGTRDAESEAAQAALIAELQALENDPHHVAYDFAMHLDHEHEIFLPTRAAVGAKASPVEFRQPGDHQHLWSAGVPQDIQFSMRPFWTVTGSEQILPPAGTLWGDVPLLANKQSGIAPAIITHSSIAPQALNASLELLREEWWPQMWFQPHLRTLYTRAARLPAATVASVMDNNGTEQVFWHPRIVVDRGGACAVHYRDKDHRVDYAWRPWADLCNGEKLLEEVFRDGMGQWVDELTHTKGLFG